MSRRLLLLVAIVALIGLVAAAAPAVAAGLNTSVTAGPKGSFAGRTATFKFKASRPGARFECKLDKKAWSSCSSPKRYTKLSQGKHTFRVRATKAGTRDRTPAVRAFTVDTVKPNTTLTGPSGEINDPTPSFTLSSTEPGTFRCRVLSSAAFKTCSSPFTPGPLDDGVYNLQVRARDRAGNLDPTPASRGFTLERVLTADLAGAQAVAEAFFPDELVMDAPPSCSDPNLKIDCIGTTEEPSSNQLSISSERDVVEVSPNIYAVTITSDVSTLGPLLLNRLDVHCRVAMTSAYGDSPTWDVTLGLLFDTHPGSGDQRVSYDLLDITGVELADWGLTPWGDTYQLCGESGIYDSAVIADAYELILDTYLGEVGNPLCAVTGPEFLGACV
jgi:hypothetical protein